MTKVKGRVSAGNRDLRQILIEVFHTTANFQDNLPLEARKDLNKYSLTRLGSAITDSAGEFLIEYGDNDQSKFSRQPCVNLWLIASSCCKEGEDIEIIFQSKDVRQNAAAIEYYPICLDKNYIDVNNSSSNQATARSPESIAENYATKQALDAAELAVSKDKFKKRLTIRRDFEKNIEPKLQQNLSHVELDKDGEPADPDYVKGNESVRIKSEKRMLTVMAKVFDVDSEKKIALSGRISLTAKQVQQLEAEHETVADEDTITVNEEILSRILNNNGESGENPENGSQIVNRVNVVELYCREKTKGERCLLGEPVTENPIPDREEDGEDGGIDEEPGIDSPQPGDRVDLTGGNVTIDGLKADIPHYIANILNEVSILDNETSPLPSPGTQLTEKDISKTSTFPSLTLPPGPADVPAYHDFYDLQIAFKPVWTEALDNSLIGSVSTIYEHYVENGGDPKAFTDAVTNDACGIYGLKGVFAYVAVPDAGVQKHIDITNEEWSALSSEHQLELKSISTKIDKYYNDLSTFSDKLLYDDGDNRLDLPHYNRTREWVTNQVSDLQTQGERFIRIAQAELERQATNKSIVPNNHTLNQLIERAASAYPAKYFAANKRQRSVNFGLLVNYRQRWTPTAYQVGELIKSMPLAPGQNIRYKKIIKKIEKRARKEIESNLDSLKSETNSTTRAEADIVQKAMNKTNFHAAAEGTFTTGIWSGKVSGGLSEDSENHSDETKKSFHEAVVKAAREYKNEHKVELETESTFESEFEESGTITNPNDELCVTYLFYELQRRYRVEERLHRLTSVVLVAQEMPCPEDIDEDWLIAHRWILNRVMLDDSFKQPLRYVAEGLVAEEFALTELRKTLAQQRRLVEELKEDVSDSRVFTESRYASLQRSMERTARATQRKSKDSGFFGLAKKLTSYTAVGAFADSFLGGGESETPETARIREAASQDAYQREIQKLRDQEGQLAQTNNSLGRATEEYTDRLSKHLANVVLVTELKNHVKDNITHYMQAIWMHEPFQQRWLRLKDVPVPVLKRAKRKYKINKKPSLGALANVAHLRANVYPFATTGDIILPPEKENGTLDTVPLYQVADIDGLLGFRANYMIFPMKKANAITDFMMEPYVEKAAGAYGITDPDDLGNISLDEFSEYVCCLKKNLSSREFEELRVELTAQLKKLLQSPLRDDEEIVVPMDATYIEAILGSTPLLENFKLLHRQIDAADAQEGLRLKKMEKIRYAQRLLMDELDDPEIEAKYVFEGNDSATIVPPVSGGTGDS
ncbi:hypothetical protein [Lunatibacter salilacus]|uniref:hypothetical protein n=1 Tax=Lunatibacter salilacus TaxID=2483804 RepID=UPI00131CC395|nr:hypothetical protein [Lunatibacter salilacus]